MNKTFAALMLSIFFLSVAQSQHSTKFEKVPDTTPSEEILIQGLIAKIKEEVAKSGVRDAHPKDHGCVDDITVKVKDGLGPLQVGVFAEAGHEYKAILRSSHGASDPEASDNEKGGHGFALKILLNRDKDKELRAQVQKLPGEEYFLEEDYYKSIDIIAINGIHEFMVSTVADYPDFFAAVGGLGKIKKALKSGTVLKPEEFGRAAAIVADLQKSRDDGTFQPGMMAKIAPSILNALYWHLPQLGETTEVHLKQRQVEARLMQTIGQVVTYDVLDTTYQSWVPSLLGKDNAVKYQFRPVACEPTSDAPTTELKGAELMKALQADDDPNRLRKTLIARLNQGRVCYELAVHVLKEGSEALVEDSKAPWPGRDEPGAYQAVATISIPQKEVGKELLDSKTCEMLSMNPGHSPFDHKPIGGIQRAREKIYAAIETIRNLAMGNPIVVP